MEQSSIRDFKVIELAFCNPFVDYTRFKTQSFKRRWGVNVLENVPRGIPPRGSEKTESY